MSKRRILCVSFDSAVSESRRTTLKEAGYDVMSTTDVKEAEELLNVESFDAVIIGHRFSRDERYLLAVEAEEKSDTPVILVCGGAQDSEIPASGRVYALEGAAGIVSALTELFAAEVEARSPAAA